MTRPGFNVDVRCINAIFGMQEFLVNVKHTCSVCAGVLHDMKIIAVIAWPSHRNNRKQKIPAPPNLSIVRM